MTTTLYSLDVSLPEIETGELVTDIVVTIRTVDPERPGRDGVYLGGTAHTGGIVQRGMIDAAMDIVARVEDDQ